MLSYRNDAADLSPALARTQRAWVGYFVVFLLALATYVISAAPGVLWQDSGIAQIRVLRGEVRGSLNLTLSHPLYYLIAMVFQYLPFSDSAYKTNLVAAFFGAVTVANVYLFLLIAVRQRFGAALGALSLLVAHTFWQHSAIAEVYTVSTSLMTAELLCFQQFVLTQRSRWLVLLFLANGLGVSNHMLAVLSLACYAVWCGWLLLRGRVGAGVLAACALVWLAGASVYLTLIVREVLGGVPVLKALASASVGAYSENVLNFRITPALLIQSVLYIGLNFPTPLILVIIPGFLAVRRLDAGRRFVLFGLLAVHTIWAVRYNVRDQYVFFIPTVLMLAIFIGFGCARLTERPAKGRRAALLLAALLPPIVYCFLPTIARRVGLDMGLGREIPFRDSYDYFLLPWKTGYRGPQHFVAEVQKCLPPDSVLVADSTSVRPLHYAELTGHWRKDIRVYPPLDETPAGFARFTEDKLTKELADGRVFVVSPKRGYCPAWLLNKYEMKKVGFLYQVVGRRPPGADTHARP